jgi:hypothetical protein
MSVTARSHRSSAFEQVTDWRRNRRLVRGGFRSLEYLPRSRTGWNATLAAYAFSVRRQVAGRCDLNQWAVMHGCPASARYEEMGEEALVLWHGTTARRAERIARYGLFHKRGVWATLEPKIAHGFSRYRARAYRAGSAAVVLLLDGRQVRSGVHYDEEAGEVLRFHAAVPAESVEYILWDDRIEFVGEEKIGQPKPSGVARFKMKSGRWVPLSQPPVRFDNGDSYDDLEGWIHLGIRRILSTLGSAAAIEIFSRLYATIDPWEALRHEAIFAALERLCRASRHRCGVELFSLRAG